MHPPYCVNLMFTFFDVRMGLRSKTAAVFGGSVFLAEGLLALQTVALLSNAASLTTTQFLQLWGSIILDFTFGLLLIVAGFLIESNSNLRRIAGGVVGSLSALIGAMNALILLNNITGFGSSSNFGSIIGNSAQLSLSFELLIPATLVTLFVGFPIGMVGSFQGLTEDGKAEGSIEQP